MINIDPIYFRNYRQTLGFPSQKSAKNFLSGKDIIPNIDWEYIEDLNLRLFEIVQKLNSVVDSSIAQIDIGQFREEYILKPYSILKDNGIIPRLNNQGRRPEHVYFSWMRGYIVSQYFLEAIEEIFSVDLDSIELVGADDLRHIETFDRTPTADLEVSTPDGKKVRLEVQAGFSGINDIKQHKVLEAKRLMQTEGIETLAIHFDLFNGQVAFVQLEQIDEQDANWVTRQQMEGQTVLAIDQNYFLWKLLEKPPKYENIKTMLES